MSRRSIRIRLSALLAVAACSVGFMIFQQVVSADGPTAFSNTSNITINDSAAPPTPASLYPSNISVAGMSGNITNVTVTLNGLSHTFPDDVDVLLVGPGGQKFVLISDVGGASAASNINLTLSDAGASSVPDGGPLSTGTFKPTDVTSGAADSWPGSPAGTINSPGPTGSATFASVYGGLSPNGTWSLYVVDDGAGDGGSISGGWTITITTAASAAATTTTVNSNINPAQTTTAVTFTATVTSASTVNNGTVTFQDGASNLTCSEGANPRPVSSGTATCTTTLAAGNRTINATYNPGAGFLTSSGSMLEQVTSVAGTQFTNPGAITIPSSGSSSPYPGQILVSGLSGTVSSLTVKLSNVSHTSAGDIDALLVSPGGQKFILVSDAGSQTGVTPTTNVTATFSDAAAALLPNGDFAWGASGSSITVKPTDYGATGTDPFGAPAPAGPYAEPASTGSATLTSTFTGAAPNGVWSLYVVDDSGGDSGTIAGGWTLDITSAVGPAATTTTVTTSGSPSAFASPVTFTATVSSGSTVNNGTVDFKDGATTLCAAVAVSAGTAQCVTSALAGGNRTITATYNPGAGFLGSSGTVLQQVTTKASNRYSNVGAITIPSGGSSSPYPSQILVSNVGTNVTAVLVTLNGFSHTAPADVDMLLVGPGGQKFVLVSDAGSTGGGVATNNVTVTFRDSAAALLPTGNTQWGADNSTFAAKPTDYGTGDTFPAPAPAGPYNEPASAGAATLNGTYGGTNPNGVWSLYVNDDTAGDQGSIAGGWSVSIITPTAADVSVSGRVVTAFGTALRGATVVLDDGTGHPVSVMTNAFGYYTASVTVGTTYMLNASARGYVFTPRVITATDTLTDVDIVASP